MGSSYFRDPNMENDRKTGDGSSGIGGGRGSRRGKKSGSDKPKQPQRGLGVAQLEKIRLHGQLGCSNFHPSLFNPNYPSSSFNQNDIRAQTAAAAGGAVYSTFQSTSFSYNNSPSSSSSAASYGYNPHFLMGNDYERAASIRYDDAQPTNCPSWIPGNPSNGTEFPQHIMRPMTPTRNLLNFNTEADSQEKNNKKDHGGSSSQNSEDQELDLELRL